MAEFGQIVDPETNKSVKIQSSIGQQVVKNYLECLRNGPKSKNIVSTRMFYKPKKVVDTKKNSKNTVKSGGGNEQSLGSVRGTCSSCRKNVYSTQERVKSSGKYFHEVCYNKQ